MTPGRLRKIASDCEDTSVVASEDNAQELRRFADELERGVNHSSWVWNRRIIEDIRAAVPNPPVLDEHLVLRVWQAFEALRVAAAFITDELETRQSSFLPDPTEEERGYLGTVQAALNAVRDAIGKVRRDRPQSLDAQSKQQGDDAL